MSNKFSYLELIAFKQKEHPEAPNTLNSLDLMVFLDSLNEAIEKEVNINSVLKPCPELVQALKSYKDLESYILKTLKVNQ